MSFSTVEDLISKNLIIDRGEIALQNTCALKIFCRDCTSYLKHEDRPNLQLLAIKCEQKGTAAKQDRMNKTSER